MKRKCFKFIAIWIVLFFTVACSLGGTKAESDIIKKLEDNGYTIEERDTDSINYYEENMVNDKYSLSLNVTGLYVGYVEQERWVEVVVFDNETEATSFRAALLQESVEGRLVIRSENVVLITFSQETIQLFTEAKSN